MDVKDDDDNSNCFFDFNLIDHFPVPGGELPSLEPGFHWSHNSFPGSVDVV
nr:Myc-type, basic helix-loop-helix (bHLH) domain-containing protein [Tanacetum cinerariifolium]